MPIYEFRCVNCGKMKEELLEAYKKHLDEIFDPKNFNLSFDEREQLISGKMKKETSCVIEQHIEKDPEGISKNDYKPDETCMCPCGTEAVLSRDKDGKPRIFEREIKTKNKPIKIREYGYYCSKCRKVFFPSPQNT